MPQYGFVTICRIPERDMCALIWPTKFSRILKKLTPDLFCLIYGTCTVDDNQKEFCHLFPLPLEQLETHDYLNSNSNKKVLDPKTFSKFKNSDAPPAQTHRLPKIDFCKLPVLANLCQLLNDSYVSLAPLEDFDNDGFSMMSSGRGSNWKGGDCLDNNPDVYPGKIPSLSSSDYYDRTVDSNCNGIWGSRNDGEPWEKILCSQSNRGVIYIGDSIGAHFHMPQVWVNPIEFELQGLSASDIILNEIDWPQHGFATGFKNITRNNILIKGPTDSFYLKLKLRNRCNHRDYQNLSQNGASSYDGVRHAEAVSRNQTHDYPATVIYAMLGNDVCNNFNNTVDRMTEPQVFRRNVMDALQLLNEKLPRNSHVLLMGLVNGNFIYPALADKLHPIGVLHKNVYYKDLYKWFSCMQIGPCNGWLHPNETLRGITTKRAEELTEILQDLARNDKFEFFDLHFIDNPINVIVNENQIVLSDMLEAVDGLHPNQRSQPLIADTLWNLVQKNLPSDVLGPVNPFNEQIKKLFGDQGGY